MTNLFVMCWEFFKAGLFAIGGGMMSLPFFYDMAERYPWFTAEDVSDMIAISEATPGPFGINMATFAGFKAFGLIGSFLGVFSMVLPSFVIVIIVAKFLNKFSENRWVKAAFSGLRPCVCALVLNAWFSIVKVTLIDPDSFFESGITADMFNFLPILFFAFILAGTRFFKKVSPAVWIFAGALLGLFFL